MNRRMLSPVVLVSTSILMFSGSVFAGYSAYTSAPLTIQSIYTNESGSSPFVIFNGTLGTACSNNGMYLYNVTIAGDANRRKDKMALALAAKMTNSRVVVDYYFDPAIGDHWEACYINAIKLID